jgi:peptidoglycan hydrolase CwlO-like protein
VLAEQIKKLSGDISDIKDQVKKVDDKLENLREAFPPRSELQALDMRHSERLHRLETKIFGPNNDGKGGGAEQITSLIEDLSTTKYWTYILISVFILIALSMSGYLIFRVDGLTDRLSEEQQTYNVFSKQLDTIEIKLDKHLNQ